MTSLAKHVTQGSWLKLGEDATGVLVVLKPDHTLTEHPLFPKWETYTDDFWKADADWRGSVDPALLPVISEGRWSISATHTLFMELDPFVLEVSLQNSGSPVYGGYEWCRGNSSLRTRYILVHNYPLAVE
jgi:hypothetical protein